MVWQADYEGFGYAKVKADSAIEFHVRYQGQYFHQETQTHYNNYRDYDLHTGRYLTPNPIGQAGGINLYAYVDNNPLSYVDPLGLNYGSNSRGINPDGTPSYPSTYTETDLDQAFNEQAAVGEQNLVDFAHGLYDGIKNQITGLWEIIKDPVGFVKDLWTMAKALYEDPEAFW